MGEQQFDIVGNFGHGVDGRMRSANGVFVVDGNGWRNFFDFIDPGVIYVVYELPCVGGKGFYIMVLVFGI